MQSTAKTVAAYLKELAPERRRAIEAIRTVIRANLDTDLEEGIQWGGISYHVPHRVYPYGYHCDPTQALPVIGLMSQKHHIGLALMCVYADPAEAAWFTAAWAKSGKKLDMGKACIRIKKLEDVPLDVIGKAVKRIKTKQFIAGYESALEGTTAGKKLAKRKAQDAGGGKQTTPAKKLPPKTAAAKKKKAGRR